MSRFTISSGSLITQMFISFSLLVLSPLLIVIIMSYSTFTSSMEEKTKQSAQYYLDHAVDTLDQAYADFTGLTVNIVKDDTLWEMIEQQRGADTSSSLESAHRGIKVKERLGSYKYLQKYLIDLGFIDLEGNVYDSRAEFAEGFFWSRESLQQMPWYRSFTDSSSLRSTYRYRDDRLVMINRINHPGQFTEYFGNLLYIIDARLFDRIFSDGFKPQASSIYVLGEQKQLIYQQGEAFAAEQLRELSASGKTVATVNGKKYLIAGQTSLVTDWFVCEVIPYDEIMKEANGLRNRSILLVLLTYFCALGVTVFLSRQIIRPLKKMMVTMRQFGTGGSFPRMEVKGPVEVKEIAERFNAMNGTIADLIADIRIEQKKAKDADLAALQAQIHPHFLYNTLNLTIYLARKNKTAEIQTLTASLIELLQHSLKTKHFVTTVASELSLIEHYVLLHQFRSEGKLSLDIQADPSMLDAAMPKFLLQPIVENAIFHGIYPKEGQGSINIVINRAGETCEIRVIDDGVGFDQQKAAASRRGVGLENVRQRMKHYFVDGESGLRIYSRPGIGTSVVLTFSLTQMNREADGG